MPERFYIHNAAVQGRVGIFDRGKGNRMVAFFLADPAMTEAAPAIAEVCARALNDAVAKRQGGNHAKG